MSERVCVYASEDAYLWLILRNASLVVTFRRTAYANFCLPDVLFGFFRAFVYQWNRRNLVEITADVWRVLIGLLHAVIQAFYSASSYMYRVLFEKLILLVKLLVYFVRLFLYMRFWRNRLFRLFSAFDLFLFLSLFRLFLSAYSCIFLFFTMISSVSTLRLEASKLCVRTEVLTSVLFFAFIDTAIRQADIQIVCSAISWPSL